MKNKVWQFKGAQGKNQFPHDSIMGRKQQKDLEEDLAKILAPCYYAQEFQRTHV